MGRTGRSRTIDPHGQAKFVDLLREGQTRFVASRAVGATGSAFRALEQRDRDFAELVEEAERVGGKTYEDLLRQEHRSRAFNRADSASKDLLIREVDARLPEFEHKRVTRHGNAPGEVLEIGASARITAEALASLPDDVLADLLRLKEIERALAEGRPFPRAIEAGEE